jgi:hypothetical protein
LIEKQTKQKTEKLKKRQRGNPMKATRGIVCFFAETIIKQSSN